MPDGRPCGATQSATLTIVALIPPRSLAQTRTPQKKRWRQSPKKYILIGMELVIRGRRVDEQDLAVIRSLLSNPSCTGRSQLSRQLCHAWNWIQPDGALKEAACRALLLQLELRGLLVLPPRKSGGVGRRSSSRVSLRLPLPLAPELRALQTIPEGSLLRLAGASDISLYKNLLNTHHYLGYRSEVGHNMRYLAQVGEHPLACLGWAAAAQKVACRDRFIGWSAEQRLKRLHLVANNTRFLVIPRVPHLASHLLAANTRRLSADWQARHGYAPVLLETFVDTTRFKGTCYKAANWIFAGLTQGRGKYDRHTLRPETVKAVWLYPLRKDFRQVLCHG